VEADNISELVEQMEKFFTVAQRARHLAAPARRSSGNKAMQDDLRRSRMLSAALQTAQKAHRGRLASIMAENEMGGTLDPDALSEVPSSASSARRADSPSSSSSSEVGIGGRHRLIGGSSGGAVEGFVRAPSDLLPNTAKQTSLRSTRRRLSVVQRRPTTAALELDDEQALSVASPPSRRYCQWSRLSAGSDARPLPPAEESPDLWSALLPEPSMQQSRRAQQWPIPREDQKQRWYWAVSVMGRNLPAPLAPRPGQPLGGRFAGAAAQRRRQPVMTPLFASEVIAGQSPKGLPRAIEERLRRSARGRSDHEHQTTQRMLPWMTS